MISVSRGPSARWKDRQAGLAALIAGLGTVGIAMVSNGLLSEAPRARRGAVIGGWLVLSLCAAVFYGRRRSRS